MTNILLEKKGLIAVATINRPKALNALNSEVLTDLDELVSAVKADADIRALVITGSGEKAFVAGADIGEMSTLTKEGGEAFGKHGNNVFRAIETLPIPTIAAVNGLRPGRRLRAEHGLRYPHLRRHRGLRPARDRPGHHPRLRRHPASGPPGQPRHGQAADLYRQEYQG